jgi:1-acyl-sn-glycerol-3-phosphate acyltransferase
VSNHRTGLDTVALHQALEGRSLAMGGVAGWPVIGRFARAQGTLFVDRGSGGSRVAAIRGVRAVLEQGTNVFVFPEGMMFPGDEVRPFFRGAFAAAVGRPVLCVGLAWPPGIEYLHDEPMPIHLFRLLWRVRIPVCCAIGEPFVASEDAAATAREAQRRTLALVARARAEFDARPR